MIIGTVEMPKIDGMEVSPGVFIVGEPAPIPGTNKFRALADMAGCLVIVELSLKFLSTGNKNGHHYEIS